MNFQAKVSFKMPTANQKGRRKLEAALILKTDPVNELGCRAPRI